jgi:uncharacterized protein
MKIQISEIPAEGLHLEHSEDVGSESVRIMTPVSVDLRVDKKGAEVILRGRVTGDVELNCGRCLQPFIVRVDTPVDITYHPVEEFSREEHYELRGDELDMAFYRDDMLDIGELSVEQMILAVPMKPLCAAMCKGICPKCGTDLNASTCSCTDRETDPRLRVLEQLLQRKE